MRRAAPSIFGPLKRRLASGGAAPSIFGPLKRRLAARRASAPKATEAGVTIIELLVTCAIVGFVLAATALTFQVGISTARSGFDETDVQQNVRVALERMVREIRGAGYDPTATGSVYHFDPVANQTATTITLLNDFNGNGALDAATGACDGSAVVEQAGYRLVGSELRRSTDPPAYTCETVILGGVSSLQLSYLDATGAATAVAANVRTVVVSMTVRSQGVGPGRQVTMTDQVRLRNR